MYQRLHGGQAVVDAAQQHALVAQRNARVGEAFERGLDLGGQLARMVDVDAHPQRMIFLQHRAEFGRDALRQEDRHARADA